MDGNVFLSLKETVKDIALYVVPIAALGLSIISLLRSSRVTKMENKLKEYDLRLKEYEIEKIENEKSKK